LGIRRCGEREVTPELQTLSEHVFRRPGAARLYAPVLMRQTVLSEPHIGIDTVSEAAHAAEDLGMAQAVVSRLAASFLPQFAVLSGLLISLAFAESSPAQERGDAKVFSLKVVGPDGQPAAGAQVEFRQNSLQREDQVLAGKFVRAARYGSFCQTTDEGELKVRLDGNPDRLTLSILTPGYGPYWQRREGF
jgi:hypothetical protein